VTGVQTCALPIFHQRVAAIVVRRRVIRPPGEGAIAAALQHRRSLVIVATAAQRLRDAADARVPGATEIYTRKNTLSLHDALPICDPLKWGYGQHIFEAIAKGSPQYTWLEQELKRPEFQQAKYKVVMFHHPPHSLGENSVPAYTDPVPVMERDDKGNLRSVRYEYPRQADYIVRDVVPLLEQAGTQLVFYGHSHWNRFVSPGGMHFLETSNVGNSYGAYLGNQKRNVPTNFKEDYAAVGDPNGLEPIVPTVAPLRGDDGKPVPYIASNDITAFSLFDTGTGTISSYYFDTRKPESAVVKFDEFKVIAGK